MKKVALPPLTILLLAILFISVSFKPKQLTANEFTLHGDVSKSKEKITKVFLGYEQNGQFIEDSTKVVNGRFYFKGAVNEPSYASLSIDSGNATEHNRIFVQLFIEPGAIKVSCNGSFSNMVITGSKSNIDLEKWLKARKPFDRGVDSIFKVLDALGTTYEKNGKTYKDSLKIATAGDKLTQIGNDRRIFDLAYLKNNTNSLIAPYLMNMLITDPRYAPQMEDIFNKFPASLQNTATGKFIKTKLALRIGSIAPDISIPDTTGKKIALSALRPKYVLLDFWASWCGPCRAESPYLLKSFRKYQDKFTILSVSLDSKGAKTVWMNAIRQDGTGVWPQVSSLTGRATPEAALYGVSIIPTNFLIDKDGRIVAKDLRGEELEKKLEELFK